MRYFPLHVHTAFSFLYGSFTPPALVEAVAARGGAGVAVCDRAGLYGMVRLAAAGRQMRILTLCGAELDLAGGGSVLLYPRDQAGHSQLCRLITRAHLENPRGKPLIRFSWLASCGRLAAVIPGLPALARGQWWVSRLARAAAGPVFMGIAGPEADGGQRGRLRRWAGQAGLEALAAPEVVALDEAGLGVHQILVQIARSIHHRKQKPLPPGAGALPTDAQMRAWFTADEIKATWRIAELCPFQLRLGNRFMPDYPLPPGANPQRELGARCLRELARRKIVDKAYAGRLLRELEMIGRFGFAPYFLLVGDLVGFARKQGIRCTVRGSAAGSMVTWLLCGGVDPLEHDLLFERFLNDGRNEPPDVDLDFDSLRRNEVFHYLMDRFPKRAAMVATVPTFRARSAVREACTALGGGPRQAEKLTELIPYYARADRLAHLLQNTPELAGHPLNKRPDVIKAAAALSGLPRQLSVHLGGVAIGPLEDVTPLELSAQGLKVIQLDKDDAEQMGLIKMDLLGLRMHTAIAKAQQFLAQKGRKPDLDRLPLDDPAVFELLCSTDTVGLFQVESPGQRGLLGRMQPRNFHELMLEISLFRPGPMRADMVTPFIARRWGEQQITYLHPALEPILAETLGVLVFQEQVLKIGRRLAGLSYGQADGLRRAMSHRRTPEEMRRMREGFLQGCRANRVSESVAQQLWEQVSSFASYGFPKAHAAAFAHITYQSAWLRAHHPLEYFLGLLNAGHVGGYPARVLLNEARRAGIRPLPPHVNHSRGGYTPEKGGIRVGLNVIRDIGPAAVEKILAARDAKGPFEDRRQLITRAGLNRRQVQALASAGALMGVPRPAALFPLWG